MDYYDRTEKILVIILFLMMMSVFGFIIFAVTRSKSKRLFHKLLFAISVVGVVFSSIWVSSAFSPSENLSGIVVLFAGILLPIIWLLSSLGFVVYGINAVVTKKTMVKYAAVFLPKKAQGAEAIYFGSMWIIAGLMMLLIEFLVIGQVLCEKQSWFCGSVEIIEFIFGKLGEMLIFFGTPLQKIGLMD